MGRRGISKLAMKKRMIALAAARKKRTLLTFVQESTNVSPVISSDCIDVSGNHLVNLSHGNNIQELSARPQETIVLPISANAASMYVTGNETLYPFHGNNNQELTASPQEAVHLPTSSNPESMDVAGNEPLYAFNGNFFSEEMELRSQEASSASAATNSESLNTSGNYALELLHGKNNRELPSFSQKNPDKPVASAGIDVTGRRLVDFSFFIQNLKRFEDHGPFDCKIKDVIIVSEMKNGLNSSFRFKCRLCNFEDVVHTNEESISINTATVLGITAIGCGFSNMEDLFSNLKVPCMSSRRFAKEQEHLTKAWEETATSEMAKAAEEEKRIARQSEDIDSDETPLLTVIVDGTWGEKRSYRTNYSSLSRAVSLLHIMFFRK
nr:uncharacterized protein LOC110282818 [Parasteatoda tepidariorum]